MPSLLSRLMCIALLALAVTPVAQARAQGLFAPAIRVNDQVVTGYELSQRIQFLSVLGATGDIEALARRQLIDDRLRAEVVTRAGLQPSPEDLAAGMAEFAARSNMEVEPFIAQLEAAGISAQTFRDFVRAGIGWRNYVQARFGPQANVDQAALDRSLTAGGQGSTIQVLLSEIIIPLLPGQQALVEQTVEQLTQITSVTEFSAAARRFSAAQTRADGGQLPWRDLASLPQPLQPILLALSPGEVTDPLPLQGAVALFQLRDIRESGYRPPEVTAVEYMTLRLPGGGSAETRARARVLAANADRCDDLYGLLPDADEDTLRRITLPPADLPTDIALELGRLDPGESSATLLRDGGDTLLFVMLCGRSFAIGEAGEDRRALAIGLRNQRLEKLAESHLEQLRASARIQEQ